MDPPVPVAWCCRERMLDEQPAKPVGFRVEAEWFVEDQAEAEQLAESLMLMGAETSSSSPAEDSCAGHDCDEMHTFVPGRCAAAVTT
ncbi:hypothetical protein [Pseudonocardia sediminis]|uniref:hypothetical protein n=1 Tax=Pseudonocardia sediminis TaxID=1397368 RepID=UPI00102A1EC7|nr:hypothetical protein [Pseudonocardia sediminis]